MLFNDERFRRFLSDQLGGYTNMYPRRWTLGLLALRHWWKGEKKMPPL